tara:strand:- start:956 stop:1669 length:714 start_codon:yes stop_codon:yes gene_type:complete
MSEIRVENIIGETGVDAVKFTKGINVTGVTTATTFSGSGASLTSLPAANLTGTLPAISGANLTGVDTYANDQTVDISTVGAGNYTFNFSNDPKKIEVTMYRGQYANGNTWCMRLRKGSSDHTTGYYDISHVAQSNNSTSTARSYNQGYWQMVNSGWTGGTNNISGTMNITRIVQGKYTFDAHWIFHYAPSDNNNEQYWLNTHGEVDIGSNACSGLKIFTSSSGNFTSGNITVRTITG